MGVLDYPDCADEVDDQQSSNDKIRADVGATRWSAGVHCDTSSGCSTTKFRTSTFLPRDKLPSGSCTIASTAVRVIIGEKM